MLRLPVALLLTTSGPVFWLKVTVLLSKLSSVNPAMTLEMVTVPLSTGVVVNVTPMSPFSCFK